MFLTKQIFHMEPLLPWNFQTYQVRTDRHPSATVANHGIVHLDLLHLRAISPALQILHKFFTVTHRLSLILIPSIVVCINLWYPEHSSKTPGNSPSLYRSISDMDNPLLWLTWTTYLSLPSRRPSFVFTLSRYLGGWQSSTLCPTETSPFENSSAGVLSL